LLYPQIEQEHADLKIKLAKEYKNDREVNAEKKTDFIKRTTALARIGKSMPNH